MTSLAEKTSKSPKAKAAAARPAEIVREYGPFPGAAKVAGVSHDGHRVWIAGGAELIAFDPDSGAVARTLPRAADAGTAFDGKHLWQIAETRIDKIDPASGDVVASIPAPGKGNDSGLAWADGSLWVGQYRDRKIHRIDPQTFADQSSMKEAQIVKRLHTERDLIDQVRLGAVRPTAKERDLMIRARRIGA